MLSKKVLSLGLVCCLWGGTAALAADSPTAANGKAATPALTAEQIVEKNVAARGGAVAWHAVQTMSWSGKMEAGYADSTTRSARYMRSMTTVNGHGPNAREMVAALQPGDKRGDGAKQVQLPFELDMKRGRQSRLQIEFAGKTAVQVYDGTNGWKVRPFLNRDEVEPFTAAEAKAEAQKADLDGLLVDYTTKGTKVALVSTEAVEGREAYKIKLTLKDGSAKHVWIDAQSFLDIRVEGAQRFMDGHLHDVWVYQRDFRLVQGVMVPYLLETVVDGYSDTHKTQIDKVTVNPKLDDNRFAKPSV